MLRRSVSPSRRAGKLQARHLTLGVAVGLIAASVSVALPTSAGASPQSDLASATAQAKELQGKLNALNDRADALDEQYNQAQNALAKANADISSTERQVAGSEARASTLRTHLGSRAASLYMGAGANSDLLGIDAASVTDLGSRAKYSEAAAAQDQRTLDDLKLIEETLHSQEKDLEHQRADAQSREQDAANARKQVEQITQQTQQLLSSAKSNIRAAMATIEQQQRAAEAAAARARIAALARQAELTRQAQDAGGGGGGGGGSGGGSGSGVYVDPSTIPAPSPGAQRAVAYAYAQLGKPYRYAGTGPDSFDCSGLTMMAWAQGGVGMAHGSQSQYDSFPHVPISQLQPGDLVFFGSSGPSNHHVGLVVGGGMMIDAPHTGAYVEKVSYMRGDLVPLGARP